MKAKLFYIQNEGFVGNALIWWAIDSHGYTTDIRIAGKYPYEDAKRICVRDEDHAYSVDYIDSLEEAKKVIIDSQYVSSKEEIQFKANEG